MDCFSECPDSNIFSRIHLRIFVHRIGFTNKIYSTYYLQCHHLRGKWCLDCAINMWLMLSARCSFLSSDVLTGLECHHHHILLVPGLYSHNWGQNCRLSLQFFFPFLSSVARTVCLGSQCSSFALLQPPAVTLLMKISFPWQSYMPRLLHLHLHVS